MILFLAVAMLVSGASFVEAPAIQEDGIAQLIAQGNAAYAQFDNQTALQSYLNALKAEPGNFEALWKGARAYADVGKAAEKSDKDEAKKLYLLGDTLARKAAQLHPDSAEAHFVLALCVGRVALFEGGKTKIRLSKEVKQEADKTIALNPRHDGAYHILGRWHYNIATLNWVMKAAAKVIYGGVPPGASLEEAAKMFAKAIELAGNKPVHRLEHGRTLIELGSYDEAREQLQKCTELAQVQWEDPRHKEEAARLLKDIEGKKGR